MPFVKAKGWAKSKTVGFGVLIVLLGLQSLLMETPLLGSYTDLALTLLGTAVVWARSVATQPLSTHPTKPSVKDVDPPQPRGL